MSISTVLKDISSVRKFFESSSRNNSEHDPSALQKSFTDSIINKLSLLKAFGPDEGAQVMDALKQSTGSPLGEIQTKRVMQCIEKRSMTVRAVQLPVIRRAPRARARLVSRTSS